jgi:hypothetical protein
VGQKLNGTHQFLAYADDVNLLGDSIESINESTETSIDASKEVGTEDYVYEALSPSECGSRSGQRKKKQTDRFKMCHSLNIRI